MGATDLDLEVYRQCHEHLRTTDRKRDQAVAFLAAVISLLLVGQAKVPDAIATEILIAAALMSLLAILAVIHYRRWHITYVRAIQATEVLLRTGHPARPSLLDYRSSPGDWVNPFMSTEAAIFYVVAILCFIPWWLLLKKTGAPVQLPAWTGHLADFLNLVGFVAAANVGVWLVLVRAERKGMSGIWILANQVVPPDVVGAPEAQGRRTGAQGSEHPPSQAPGSS